MRADEQASEHEEGWNTDAQKETKDSHDQR